MEDDSQSEETVKNELNDAGIEDVKEEVEGTAFEDKEYLPEGKFCN